MRLQAIKIFTLIVVLFLVSGCAALQGGGSYQYEKFSDGTCKLTINSNRTVDNGVSLMITDNCGLKVESGGLVQGAGFGVRDLQQLQRFLSPLE